MSKTEPATVRHDWSREEVREIFQQPLMDLLYQAHVVHRNFHRAGEVQKCQLLSIKTGGCPEDCAYCPQSAHYKTGVEMQPLMQTEEVVRTARAARQNGATRFCMGAAWRQAPQGRDFDTVLETVRGVAGLGMEVCCTLGMLTESQARQLKQAGLTAYNHNLDTSPEFYNQIISTRTYEERLRTLEYVRNAGIQVCCGGILGMGEGEEDRVGLLHRLSTLQPHPESVPINMLVRAHGTPLEGESALDPLVMVRAIATARILMPRSRVRLAAGRLQMSREATALCFFAGANSIFIGEKLLTTPNPEPNEDEILLEELGLETMA